MKKLLLILFFVLLTCNSWATIYYVDTASIGGTASNSNLGTISEPWETISKANSTLVPGDIVYLRAGVYTSDGISPINSGTVGNKITYSAYQDEYVELKNLGVSNAASGQRALVMLPYLSYIEINKLTITMPNGSFIVTYHSDHIYFNDCVASIVLGDLSRSIKLMYSSHLYFVDCSFDDTGMGDVYSDLVKSYDSEYILFLRTYFGNVTHSGYEDYGSNYLVFRECVIENKYHSGLSIGGYGEGRYLVDNCIFKNMGELPNPIKLNDKGNDPALYHREGRSIVRNNIFYNNNNHWNTRSNSPFLEYQYNWIYQNTMYDAIEHNPVAGDLFYTGTAWFIGTGEASTDQMQYNHIINNIMWKSEELIQIAFNYSDTPNDPHDNVISYNVVGDPTNPLLTRWRDALWRNGENLIATEANNIDWVSGTNIEADPLFVDADSHNFNLQAGSPCINAGRWLTTILSATNTGQTVIIVGDANPFYSGAGSPWLIEGEVGDSIKTEGGEETVIQSINHATNTLTVSPAIDIIQNEGLSLTYTGSAPDIGALEYTMAISSISPGSNSTGISVTTDLNWTNPQGATSIDLFFDKKADHDPPTTVRLNDQNVETWDCGTLDYSTEYAWRVDVNHATGTEIGTVYYFTTTSEANPPISEASVILYHKNAGIHKYHKNGMVIR